MVEIDGRQYLTPDEAALILDVTPDHVRALLRAGQIEGWQERRRRWALKDSVRRYAAGRAVGLRAVVVSRPSKGGA